MDSKKVDEILLQTSVNVATIKKGMEYVATKEDVRGLIDEHRKSCSKIPRPSPANIHRISKLGNQKIIYPIGSLIAGAGAAIGWLVNQFFFH